MKSEAPRQQRQEASYASKQEEEHKEWAESEVTHQVGANGPDHESDQRPDIDRTRPNQFRDDPASAKSMTENHIEHNNEDVVWGS